MKLVMGQPYPPEVLHRLQMVEFDMLKRFDAMCRKHHLEYYAIYGTLLGAVRHQGLIPWDDDIDICMPRRDYDKLASLIPEEFGEGYTLLDACTDPNYPYVNARIIKEGTAYKAYSARKFPINQGIFLDIWIVDNIPDDERLRRQYIRKTWIWEKICVLRINPFPALPLKGLKKAIVSTACFLASCVIRLFPAEMLHRVRLKETVKYNGEETEMCGIMTGFKYKGLFKRSQVYPLKQMPYDDMIIPVPNDTHALLVMEYGPDYMTPPPATDRINSVVYEVCFGDESECDEPDR